MKTDNKKAVHKIYAPPGKYLIFGHIARFV